MNSDLTVLNVSCRKYGKPLLVLVSMATGTVFPTIIKLMKMLVALRVQIGALKLNKGLKTSKSYLVRMNLKTLMRRMIAVEGGRIFPQLSIQD
jgi:hypothetical protein